MPDAAPARSAVIRFRDVDVEVDLRTGTVTRGGLRVRLPQPSLDILRLLLAAPGELVDWPLLRDRLWDHGTESEFEDRVNVSIERLRDAFGDDPDRPRFVETVPTRGFRLVAPIEPTRAGRASNSGRPASSQGPRAPGQAGSGSVPGEIDAGWPSDAAPLTTDAGRYELLERIGAGAMGEVYRARDLRLDREVAIKFLPEWMANDPLALHRFRREAHATASLNHGNVLAVYDLTVIDGAPCLVSELLVGQTLRTTLGAGSLEVDHAVGFAQQILDGLAAAHAKGIVHRDLKPENLFVTRDGHLKILDFGLAKQVEREDGSSLDTTLTPTTRAGAVLGTLGYQSPEQARGGDVDVRTDLFAFGAVFYELLTGRRPFHRHTEADTIAAMLHDDPAPPSTLNPAVPASCDRIVAKALEKDRELRYQSAAEARADIRRVVRELGGGSSSHSYASQSRGAVTQPPKRKRRRVAAVIAVGALVVTAAAWLLAFGGDRLPSFTPLQLTRGTGVESEPAISPDGNLVAYTSDESGSQDIWLFDLRNRTTRNLTEHVASDRHASWAADGSSLYFVSDRDGSASIWRTPVLGGQAVRVIDSAEDVAVSPDGQHLAFARPVAGYHRIFVVPVADPANARQVTKAGEGLWSHRNPAWSPDSTTICYMTNRQLWVVAAAGGEARRLVAQGDYDTDPAWSHGGRALYYSSSRGGGQSLWRTTISPGPVDRLLFWRRPGPRAVIGGSGPEQEPVVSADGRRLAYSTLTDDTNLVVVDLRAQREATWGTTQNESFPSIAPDGSRVYYVSRADPPFNQLWVQDLADGKPVGGARRLTDHKGYVSQPACSPDGRWVAYYLIEDVRVGAEVKERRALWIIAAAGSAPVRVTDGPNDTQPVWSPAGDALAFTRATGDNGRVWTLAVRDGRATGPPGAVTSGRGDEGGASWGADGIAFLRAVDDRTTLCLVRPDGTGERQIAFEWTPVKVAWDTGVPGAILVAAERASDGDTAELVRIAAFPDRDVPPLPAWPLKDIRFGFFSMTPDGRLLTYTRSDRRGDIWLLEAKGRGRF